MAVVAGIAIEKTNYGFDKLFDYLLPRSSEEAAMIGCRVIVPFGCSNKKRQGMIFSIRQEDEPENLKEVCEIIDKEPILSDELIEIVKRMVHCCFCTYYDAIKTVLPAGFNYLIAESYCLKIEQLENSQQQWNKKQTDFINQCITLKEKQKISAFIQQEKTSFLEPFLREGIIVPQYRIKRKTGDKFNQMVRLTEKGLHEQHKQLTKKQKKVIDFLIEHQDMSFMTKELCYVCGITETVLKNLEKQKQIEFYQREHYRIPYTSKEPLRSIDSLILSEEQEKVFLGMCSQFENNVPSAALLYGVTGSGKTQVYIKLIQYMINRGKQSILMVPEIALTSQLVKTVQDYFGAQVAVMHSALTLGEQLDEYKRIQRNEVDIVIGTRSAVFAPFSNIGLMIMDEEGESSYKSSDMSPRYHARDIAKFRCCHHKALLLLASATPAIDSYYQTERERYQLYSLNERYSAARLPNVNIIDMRSQPKHLTNGLSNVLLEALDKNIRQREQSILLLNRRGYASAAVCVDCGEVIQCPHCSANLTYHQSNEQLICHYCGFMQDKTLTCSHCHSEHILFTGIGTQQIQKQLNSYFPSIKVLRMDADTVYSREKLDEKITAFANEEYDILIGTQIVAKGFNFPNVTLVGVLCVDNMLFGSDFRSHERAFSLLTQVIGRSGRVHKSGKAYIQTYYPDHPVILQAARQDYPAFYHSEIEERKLFLYPPFCDLCIIGISAKSEKMAHNAALFFISECKNAAAHVDGKVAFELLGISKPYIYKLNDRFRFRIIIKCHNNIHFRRFLKPALKNTMSKKEFASVRLYADFNGEIV